MTAGSPARPPRWDPTGGVLIDRCPDGAGQSQGGEGPSALLADRVRCDPDIRGDAPPPPAGRVAAFRRATRPAAARGRSIRTTPRPQADRAGDPMRASIRGPDRHCQ